MLLHRVEGGETFDEVDAKYQTTAAVIRSLNYSIQISLLAHTVILIGPGFQVVEPSLPSFRLRQVGQPPATIENLAAQLHVDAALLRRYNGCSGVCWLAPGDWILIPVLPR